MKINKIALAAAAASLAATPIAASAQDSDGGGIANGAIVAAGNRVGVATPHNETMVWMIKAAEARYSAAKA